MAVNNPRALVFKWDASRLWVVCPYCEDSHEHGIGSAPWTERKGAARCPGKQKYVPTFPFGPYTWEEEAVGWELSLEDQCFYTTDKNGRKKDPAEERKPGRKILPNFDVPSDGGSDSDEEIILTSSRHGRACDQLAAKTSKATLSDLEQQRSLLFDDCWSGKLERVRKCLQAPGAEKIRTAVDDDRRTAVHMAVMADDNHDSMLSLLKSHGFEFDQENKFGRTPLMEAALWGRYVAVEWLVENDANVMAVDANKMFALEFAKPTRRNEHERETRTEEIRRPRESDSRRRHLIVGCLERKMRKLDPNHPCLSRTARSQRPDILGGIFTTADEERVLFYRPTRLYELPSRNKTIGELDRGPGYPPCRAMSGYTKSVWCAKNDMLNNRDWTEQARELCRKIGHTCDKDDASHAEKQLFANYFIRHLDGFADIGVDKMWRPSNFPPLHVTINNRQVCPDCENFIKRFKEKYRCVQVTVKALEEKV